MSNPVKPEQDEPESSYDKTYAKADRMQIYTFGSNQYYIEPSRVGIIFNSFYPPSKDSEQEGLRQAKTLESMLRALQFLPRFKEGFEPWLKEIYTSSDLGAVFRPKACKLLMELLNNLGLIMVYRPPQAAMRTRTQHALQLQWMLGAGIKQWFQAIVSAPTSGNKKVVGWRSVAASALLSEYIVTFEGGLKELDIIGESSSQLLKFLSIPGSGKGLWISDQTSEHTRTCAYILEIAPQVNLLIGIGASFSDSMIVEDVMRLCFLAGKACHHNEAPVFVEDGLQDCRPGLILEYSKAKALLVLAHNNPVGHIQALIAAGHLRRKCYHMYEHECLTCGIERALTAGCEVIVDPSGTPLCPC
ncbi:uncharacterized protein VTP21DRAFT_3179 [Calcarisporiella thermophila]|uniref:uncharacterized protein n=1 Tax=Calcarisporiella thermophila TaxID=911321 RepID=UPI0037448886